MIPYLTPHEPTLTPDLPGHGANQPADPKAYTMDAAAQALIKALGDERLDLYGYSMGGRLALYLALTFPAHVATLTLESASPGLPTEAERAARRAADNALADRIEQHGIAAFVEEWERLPLWASQAHTLTAQQRATLRQQRLTNRPHGLANSLRGMGTGIQPSLWAHLPTLTPPVLLITGVHDVKFDALAAQMAAQMPQAQHVRIPEAGHAAHLEQPQRVAAAWETWLLTQG